MIFVSVPKAYCWAIDINGRIQGSVKHLRWSFLVVYDIDTVYGNIFYIDTWQGSECVNDIIPKMNNLFWSY